MANKPSTKIQERALAHVLTTFEDYKKLTQKWRERMYRIYKSFSTFEEEKRADWDTNFKVNKAHEVVRKVHPRIVAKAPRWIVTPAMDDFWPDLPLPDLPSNDGSPEGQMAYDEALTKRQEEIDKRTERASEMARGIQDYLSYVIDEYNLMRLFKAWGLSFIVYGKAWAKVKYKYEMIRRAVAVKEFDQETGEEVDTGEVEYTEDVRGEYPTIEVKSWTEMYFDPRYRFEEDLPARVEITENVRLSDLKRYPDRYFNLDKLEKLKGAKNESELEDYKKKVQQLTGINASNLESKIDENALTLKKFYGYFCEEDGGEEKKYEICVAADLFVISYKEILEDPFEAIECFIDPETGLPVGFVEPIIGLQDEMNFKKNSASQYVNTSLNRSYIWSPNSGINPRDLVNKPNNIIVSTKDVQTAKMNWEEIPHRQLNSDYFQEQNDFERQIQGMTFTVDTANQKNQQALTNTATGIRVKFFESNSVIDEVRKNFEDGLARIAYKLLQSTFENMEDNIVIKKTGAEGFWEINKELLRDALMRYSIKVEVNSSSFDDLESRREEATAWFNVMAQAKEMGVPVNLVEGFKDIAHTFEKKDVQRFLEPPNMQQVTQQTMQGGMPIEAPPVPNPGMAPEQMTQAVAGGDLTTMSR